MNAPKIFFYVQHLLGIGHLARASRIASAMVADGFDLRLVTGGAPVASFPEPGIDQIALPPVVASDAGFGGLATLDGGPADDEFRANRRDRLLSAFAEFRPDIVIIEAFPFGRRQMRFELLPLLDAIAAAQPRPKLVTSVRDILQERVKPGRNEETRDLVDRCFDLVMVHGDPAFVRLDETFPLAASFAGKIAYTGLVAGAAAPPSDEHYDVVVSAGGGAAGRDLVRATVDAARLVPGLSWALITGPNLPADDCQRAEATASANLSIFRFRSDFLSLLAAAELSVSQAGYNTVCDLLQARCRSILVPFAAGGETEQTARALRLRDLGFAAVIDENELSPQALAQAVELALAKPKPGGKLLRLDGAAGSARVLRDLLQRRG